MSGEPWETRAPWHSDISVALATTRERVFREGSYRRVPGKTFESLAALDAFFLADPEFDEDGLWDSSGASGTCSILDIRDVDQEVGLGATAPLCEDDVQTLFGTLRPNAAHLTSDRKSQIYARLTRGDSIYIVLYAGETPTEIVFFGYSVD